MNSKEKKKKEKPRSAAGCIKQECISPVHNAVYQREDRRETTPVSRRRKVRQHLCPQSSIPLSWCLSLHMLTTSNQQNQCRDSLPLYKSSTHDARSNPQDLHQAVTVARCVKLAAAIGKRKYLCLLAADIKEGLRRPITMRLDSAALVHFSLCFSAPETNFKRLKCTTLKKKKIQES